MNGKLSEGLKSMRTLAKLLLLVILIAAADAEAKVCFLPGVLNGDGCIDNSSWLGTGCQGYDRTTPCPEGYQEQTCIYNDKTYYRCSCNSDNVLDLENGKYICTGTFNSVCGCAGSETICNPARYPYESCADYTNASGSGDSCRSPADGSIRYEECACSRTVYPYSCDERGLKEPSGTDYCEEPDGSRWYPYCICDDSYSTEECSSRTDGCTTLVEQVYNGHDNCYLCSAETCSEEGQINLEAYWCNVTQTTVTDCATLGYVKATKCDDGTTGVKCPFDSSYMYCPGQEETDDDVCPAGSSSKYQKVEDCGDSGSAGWNIYTKKVVSGNKVIVCGACAAKSCPTGYTAGDLGICRSDYKAEYHSTAYAGDTGCYRCVKDCPAGYSANRLQACFVGQTLQEHATVKGCYKCVTLQCTDGYAKTAADCGKTGTKGWKLGTDTDEAGCYQCETKSCATDEFGMNSVLRFCGVNMSSTLGDSYRGDRQCYKCICIDGFVKDVSECGQSGGWELDTSIIEANENGSGDVSCYKCKAKTCPTGPGITTNRSECYNSPYYGYESTVGYAGNDTCYKCQLCPDGQYHTAEYECFTKPEDNHWTPGKKNPNPNSVPYVMVTDGCFELCYDYNSNHNYVTKAPTKKQ